MSPSSSSIQKQTHERAHAHVGIQARFNSSRLPGKVLLPIHRDTALLELLYRRVASEALTTTVLTSAEASDDAIADLCAQRGLPHFRGSLNDVLGRYLQKYRSLDDVAIIVRVTADNPLVNHLLVSDMVRDFVEGPCDLLTSTGTSPHDGLPYGYHAEVFRLGGLRESHKQMREDDPRREHVTLWLKENSETRWYQSKLFLPEKQFADLKCTVDTFNDFLTVQQALREFDDPVNAPIESVFAALRRVQSPVSRCPMVDRSKMHSRSLLCLGAVQLGLPYGMKKDHLLTVPESRKILAKASECGVTHVDTARAYGQSESRVGSFLQASRDDSLTVYTKLSGLSDVGDDSSDSEVVRCVEQSVHDSLRNLKKERLDALLLHRAEHLHFRGGLIVNTLATLCEAGLIGKLGASVQTPAELESCLGDPRMVVLQVPYNLLDWRWEPFLERLNTSKLEVFVRSVLLQGVLAAPHKTVFEKTGLSATESSQLVDLLNTLTKELGCEGPVELALRYVHTRLPQGSIVLGVHDPAEIPQASEFLKKGPFTESEVQRVVQQLPRLEEAMLDPSQWPQS